MRLHPIHDIADLQQCSLYGSIQNDITVRSMIKQRTHQIVRQRHYKIKKTACIYNIPGH
jgi:hypothetical protein